MLHSLLLYGIQATGEGDNSDKCCLISDTTYYDSHLKTSEYSSDFWKIMCSVLMFFCNVPYQKTTMGMIWQSLGHIWPICGNGMGRLGDGMELMWDLILAKCNLWKIYGMKR